MKKILLLFLLTILLTGCSATYDIEFTEDKIKDEIRVFTDTETVNNATQATIDSFSNKILEWERGHDHYTKEVYTTDKITGYLYKYDFNYDEYDAMSQIRKCYENFNFTYNDKEIILTTSNKFLCKDYYQDVNNLTINIKTDKKVISSNADSTKNNILTWNINKSNYQNKPLNLRINLQETYEKSKDKNIDLKQILIIILFILLIIIYIINKKDIKRKGK